MNQSYFKKNNVYLSLCYHYLRPERDKDQFPRILGHRLSEFNKHILWLKENFAVMSLNDAIQFSYDRMYLDRCGMLLTFDDGLSDHFMAAKILAEQGIKAVFFIPTCILSDNEPANPVIIHYCIAHYGISKFLCLYADALSLLGLNQPEYQFSYNKEKDSPWNAIAGIKNIFKYKLNHNICRKVLLHIYYHSLARDFPRAMNVLHLTKEQIIQILEMGHSIGAHSHSHISVASTELNKQEFYDEIIFPKEFMESQFKTDVLALSYPFGGKQDCLDPEILIKQTDAYMLAFSIEKKSNSHQTLSYDLGRYSTRSSDRVENIHEELMIMLAGEDVL